MALELVDYLQGSFSLIFVIISLIIGMRILSKYFEFKNRLYILVGISWIGVANPWMPDSISFLMNLIVGESLDPGLYFIIGNCFLPIALLTWFIAFTDMIYRKAQKKVIIITIILSIIFEIEFFTLFFIDINLIGNINPLSRPFTANFGLFITIYLLVVIVAMVVTGVIFAQKSIKLEDPEVRLKGKLLRAAFITFAVAAVLDSMLGTIFEDPTDPLLSVMVVAVRILLIFSALEFYGGFLLPRWMKEIFMKSK
ncbi:MAG: hypothetical protein JSV23_02795 [Promethearchaeota archaeon]|nr:MAG: hypothetical protein JSV23_02795 [Candidatus Lokiarchaeota archaeon]